MVKHNTDFHLTMEDIDLIERALRKWLDSKDPAELLADDSDEARMVNELLGRLHNQKIFFRPKDQVYIGG
jgi:hypothetical protein